MGNKLFVKKLMPLALAAAMTLQAVPVIASQNDISGHWAEKTITEWQEKGFIKGYKDGSFKPDNSITRAEFVVIMNNAKGFTNVGKISLKDVSEGDWFYEAVAKAVAEGYANGYEDGTFRPDNTITRAEAAVMMAKVMDLKAEEDVETFSDNEEIPSWAKNSVNAVASVGFMKGYPDGTFKGNAPITRAEAVTALNNMLAYKEDLIITEDGTVVKDKVITGDLIIEESVGEGDVYLENVTVEGETFVRGGGSHSIHVENSKFVGAVNVEKTDAHLDIGGGTSIADMVVTTSASMTFDSDFDGEVAQVTVSPNNPNGKVIIEGNGKTKQPINKLIVESKSDISLNSNVAAVLLGEGAEDSEIEVKKDAAILHMEIQAKSGISGQGTIHILDVGASGVTTTRGLTVEETTISNGAEFPIERPSTAIYGGGSMGGSSSSSSSSSGGSSSRPSKPTVTIAPDIINLQTARDATFYADAAVTADDLKISVVKGGAVLENGTDYDLTISTGSANASIRISFKAALDINTTYQVTIEPSSVGAGKYSIEKTTTELATPKTLVWNATSTGIESIIHNTAIPEDGAKVTFTVTGAIFNDESGTIGAKLQANSPGAEEIFIENSKITPTIGGNTITVSLAGQSLSVCDYILTLSVDKNRLNLIVPYVADELSTATTTITITEKPVTMGEPTSNFTEITSGATLPTGNDVLLIAFPATGIASLSVSGAPTATITPAASGIETDISANPQPDDVQYVVVKLTGTAPSVTEDTTYTVTLTIPAADITPKNGYTAPAENLTKTFTFAVKPAPTTTPVTARVDYNAENTLFATEGETLSEGTKLSIVVTGASAVDIGQIQVIAFQGETEANFTVDTTNTSFTAPTGESKDGTLTIVLTGVAPTLSTTGTARENGLKVVIPKEAFTPMDGYTLPSGNITIQDFKFVLNPAPAPEIE